MIKSLLSRPIAVSMSFIAILLLSAVAINKIPVSLLPQVDIPEITVQLSYKNASAREMENSLVSPIRRQLMQINHLDDITSNTHDGQAIIRLKLQYGTNINLAYIEVNEKIDRLLGSLPKDLPRPKIIKANASDLPIFTLLVSRKNYDSDTIKADKQLIELSKFTDAVIRKRLEQQEQVAMVDMSGRVFAEILITPNKDKLLSLGMAVNDITDIITSNNYDYGNLSIIDGQYQYSLRFASRIKSIDDIKNIYFKIPKTQQIIQIKDIAEVKESVKPKKGLCMINGKPAISLAIIKKSDAQIQQMEKDMGDLISEFKKDYPEIEFHITQDQTKLLDYSITNLKQSLIGGGILAFIIIFFFLKDFKAPWLIVISIPTSILISLLFFFIIDISLNIISISGLILGVGMMIDNSIIVIDNIVQFRERGHSLLDSCARGTQEVIRPLISSVLTTCAVFVPLIFISGIAGALFYDQAMAVAIGLIVSLLVSISLLPVYYNIFYKKEKDSKLDDIFRKLGNLNYEETYEKGLRLCFRNQICTCIFFVSFILIGAYLLQTMPKKQLPKVEQHEQMINISWNERININENTKRVKQMLVLIKDSIQQSYAQIGENQFLLNHQENQSIDESKVYLKLENEKQVINISKKLKKYFSLNYPKANVIFYAPPNLFEQVFSNKQAPLTVRLAINEAKEDLEIQKIKSIRNQLEEYSVSGQKIELQEHILYTFDPSQLATYKIEVNTVYKKLKTLFNNNQILQINDNNQSLAIIIGNNDKGMLRKINLAKVKNTEGDNYSMGEILQQRKTQSLKNIKSGKEGNYYPIELYANEKSYEQIIAKVKQSLSNNEGININFAGSIFANKELVNQLMIILLISMALLYFILASQFESFIQPLIVLIEVPIDIGGALLLLYVFGGTINLMSLIGIVVMSGIIINDSILKIDTINRLREEGYTLLRAISTAGQRRLKPILMTSLTTILALLPFLFTHGLGADLQKPLAYTIVGGMTLGTVVSLYFVPLFYYRIYRNHQKK